MGVGGSKGKVSNSAQEAPEETEAINQDRVGDGGFWIGSKTKMKKEKNHHPFANSVAADTDGESGGAEDEDKNEASEGVGDRKIERAGEQSGAGKAEKVYTDGDKNDGNSVPSAVNGVAQASEKVDEDSAAGEFLRQGKIGKKSRNDKTEKKEKSTEGAKPRKSGGEGGEGGVGAKPVGGARKKKKGEAE